MDLLLDLSKNFVNYQSKQVIEIKKKPIPHTISHIPGDYKRNTSGFYPSLEKEAYQFLSEYFAPLKWKKRVKLDCLRNPLTNRKLEIDCYCPELKIGIEADGEYHKVYSHHYHKTRKNFQKQKERDHIKDILCQKNGIKLIRIPYDVHKDDLEGYIIREISKRI